LSTGAKALLHQLAPTRNPIEITSHQAARRGPQITYLSKTIFAFVLTVGSIEEELRQTRPYHWPAAGAAQRHLAEAVVRSDRTRSKNEYLRLTAIANRRWTEIYFGDAAQISADSHAGRPWGPKGDMSIVKAPGARQWRDSDFRSRRARDHVVHDRRQRRRQRRHLVWDRNIHSGNGSEIELIAAEGVLTVLKAPRRRFIDHDG